MLLLENQPETPINLGNPVEFSMLELARKVIESTKSKSLIEYEPLPLDDPRQRRPDISLASATLKWSPHISLEDGIRLTSDYFAKELKA